MRWGCCSGKIRFRESFVHETTLRIATRSRRPLHLVSCCRMYSLVLSRCRGIDLVSRLAFPIVLCILPRCIHTERHTYSTYLDAHLYRRAGSTFSSQDLRVGHEGEIPMVPPSPPGAQQPDQSVGMYLVTPPPPFTVLVKVIDSLGGTELVSLSINDKRKGGVYDT